MDNIIIIFTNRTDTLRLYECLRQIGIRGVIVPSPNQLAHSCGISLKTQYRNLDKALYCIRKMNLKSFDHIYLEKKNMYQTSYVKVL